MTPQGQFFDATQFDPTQGIAKHPLGKFPAGITATAIKPNNANDGQFLEIMFTTQAGQIAKRFNLWNNSSQAVEIAQRELSALCHATGIYKLDMAKQGAELLNAGLMIEVRAQANNDKYNEVGKVFDKDGNEPGSKGSNAAPPQTQQTAAPQPQQAWNQQPQPQPQQTTAPAGGGSPWQPGGGASAGGDSAKAPWQK